MMEAIYYRLLSDAKNHNKDSVLYKHHIEFVKDLNKYSAYGNDYEETDSNQIVVDFISSMTDDYFVDLYKYLFPKGKYDIQYKGYFD